jgi:hypothetical protein
VSDIHALVYPTGKLLYLHVDNFVDAGAEDGAKDGVSDGEKDGVSDGDNLNNDGAEEGDNPGAILSVCLLEIFIYNIYKEIFFR